jgi:transcriptional regulator with XRE-family HTH domain
MATRKALSKKIRFEVFKRDKFTCQYCGRKAPDVVLNIDHINPVAKEGTNELMNLITSCFDCNNGKRDKKLDDSSIVEKQRKQLELLQERREQIELMLEWKKSLSNFDNDVVEMLVDYINSKIAPLSLNENGQQRVVKWLKKFSTEQILDAIDISANQYLQYENGEIEQTSAETFLKKIGGVITVKNMPPIKQKLAYIKGIARNRFSYFDEKTGSIILENYVNELEKHWEEQQILDDLETEVSKITKDAKNWTEWRGILEGWIEDIKKWGKSNTKVSKRENLYKEHDITIDSLESSAHYSKCCAVDRIESLIHIGLIFPKFNPKAFSEEAFLTIRDFINQLQKVYDVSPNNEVEEDEDFVSNFVSECSLIEYFNIPDNADNYGVLLILSKKSHEIIDDMLSDFYLPRTLYKRKDIDIMLELYKQYYNE